MQENINNDKTKYMANGKFDAVSFNNDFAIILKKQLVEAETIEEKALNKYNSYYNAIEKQKNINKKYESTINSLSLSNILIKWNDNIINIISDIFNGNNIFDSFGKEDRLIYIGLTLILIGILGYIINQYLINDHNTLSSVNLITNNYLYKLSDQENMTNIVEKK